MTLRSPPTRTDRRWTWVMIGIGLNTAASLTAIALWLFSPGRAPAPSAPAPPSISEAPAYGQDRPAAGGPGSPPFHPPRRPARRADRGDANDPVPLTPVGPMRKGPAAPDSVTALAERLHLNPRVLVADLGDERGELSPAAAKRLERAFEAAESMARRLGLDEPQSRSLVNVLTSHTFRMLVEEKAAFPSPVDPERSDEIMDETVGAVRAACGEPAAILVQAEIASL